MADGRSAHRARASYLRRGRARMRAELHGVAGQRSPLGCPGALILRADRSGVRVALARGRGGDVIARGRVHLAAGTSNMQLISGYRTLPSAADDNRLDAAWVEWHALRGE